MSEREGLNQNLTTAMVLAYIKKHQVDQETAEKAISKMYVDIADSVSELDEEELDA